MSTPKKQMVLIPRNGMFFRDSRGWATSQAGRGQSLSWPFPSSMRGAFRTAWGLAFSGEKGISPDKEFWQEKTIGVRLQGMLALRHEVGEAWAQENRMWPVPQDALYLRPKNSSGSLNVERLHPKPPIKRYASMGRKELPAIESLLRAIPSSEGKPGKKPDWWTELDFINWLCNKPVKQCNTEEDLQRLSLSTRSEVHVTLDPKTYAAKDAMMYAKDIKETLIRVQSKDKSKVSTYEWALALSVDVPEESSSFPPSLIKLGGKSHIAYVEKTEKGELFAFPKVLEEASKDGCKRLRLICITPAYFEEGGWLPNGFEAKGNEFIGKLSVTGGSELKLCAALLDRAQHVSGWDMAKGQSKRTKRLVPAGTVYYIEKKSGESFTSNEIKAFWLTQIGSDQEDGFGLIVAGLWPK